MLRLLLFYTLMSCEVKVLTVKNIFFFVATGLERIFGADWGIMLSGTSCTGVVVRVTGVTKLLSM
jgi:hypothetical protein